MPHTYDYPRPALTVDTVLFGFNGTPTLQVLLIQRAHEPFAGHWALPGGFVDAGEDLPKAALRELAEETGLQPAAIEQLRTFGKPGRDPRGWVVSVAFYGLVHRDSQEVRAADDARQVAWFPVEELPPLAFDHADILATGLRRLRLEARLRPIGLEVLSAPFTFTELVVLYEAVRGSAKLPVDRLCGRLLDWGVLLEVGSRHGIALHRFDEEKYRRRLHERQEGSVP